MKVAIVGHAAEKFTGATAYKARLKILQIIQAPGVACVISGHSPMGGVDIWAEEAAEMWGFRKHIYPARTDNWEGFKERNLLIAGDCDTIHVIVVDEFPPGYAGQRHPYCYHCHTREHIKSGACWTAKKAQAMGKPAFWHVIRPATEAIDGKA